MKKLIVVLLVGLLAIGGAYYGKEAYEKYSKEAQYQEALKRTVDADEIEASKDAVDLSWDECKEFTELLDSDEYNGFYRVTFDNPQDIDWNEVLADGAGITREKISKKEKEYYLDEWESYHDSLDYELIAISGASIKDYIYKHTGTSIDLKDDLLWVYNKDKDVYYNELGYLQYTPCTCVSGVKLNDTYVLEVAADDYDFFDNPNKKMVLIKTENGYLVKSNVNVWEVGNDKKLTFDVDIPQLSADARLVTYQSDDAHFDDGNSARIAIIGDNQLVDFVNLYASEDDDIIDIRKITHIEVCDLNCDGVNDVIAIGYDNHSILKTIIFTTEKKYDDTYGLFTSHDLSFSLSNELADNLTIDSVKEAIVGKENQANHSWQDAYNQFLKVEGSDYNETYALAYIDGDDIPELIEEETESINIYTFKDGLVTPIAIELDYYVTGEEPYQYSPHNNWIKLHDEESGSDYYTNQTLYYSIKKNKLERIYCLSYDYDNTADEDNEAEENSLIATVKPTDYTKNIPDEEVLSLIEDIEENKFIDLVGKYPADELIKLISDKY